MQFKQHLAPHLLGPHRIDAQSESIGHRLVIPAGDITQTHYLPALRRQVVDPRYQPPDHLGGNNLFRSIVRISAGEQYVRGGNATARLSRRKLRQPFRTAAYR